MPLNVGNQENGDRTVGVLSYFANLGYHSREFRLSPHPDEADLLKQPDSLIQLGSTLMQHQ